MPGREEGEDDTMEIREEYDEKQHGSGKAPHQRLRPRRGGAFRQGRTNGAIELKARLVALQTSGRPGGPVMRTGAPG